MNWRRKPLGPFEQALEHLVVSVVFIVYVGVPVCMFTLLAYLLGTCLYRWLIYVAGIS